MPVTDCDEARAVQVMMQLMHDLEATIEVTKTLLAWSRLTTAQNDTEHKIVQDVVETDASHHDVWRQ